MHDFNIVQMPKLYAEVQYQRVLRLFENQSDHSKPMVIKKKAMFVRKASYSKVKVLWENEYTKLFL